MNPYRLTRRVSFEQRPDQLFTAKDGKLSGSKNVNNFQQEPFEYSVDLNQVSKRK
jgi:hypothetical protein